jgi:hypothetical protein
MEDISPTPVSDTYSGCPSTMPLDDLWDRLEALFAAQEAKSNSKQKKFTKAVFLRQCDDCAGLSLTGTLDRSVITRGYGSYMISSFFTRHPV